MTPFEYILPLVSVLVGLAIADLAVSFNRLLRARHRVSWDWLTLLSAFIALLAVLDIWWMFSGEQDATFYYTLAGFLPFAVQLILLFLINAAALPDDVPEEGISLKEFYAANSVYLWGLFTVYFLSIFVSRAITHLIADGDVWNMLTHTVWNVVMLAFFGSLILIKRRWYHGVVLIVFLIVYFSGWSLRTLG
ncbi:hypothetical protein [Lewinella sp. JB7]|uniref:hypothetical protein n=1 Tax=Lewinella sp. JB7 TaxID=2962887 RepID=UPI0020C995F2|nr:hypothetical protein [Lewinella sp. JB7]MCP9235233.1 hypothetical protein [Lewinella sp. JB7]